MWRTNAVVSMLVEEVAGQPSADPQALAKARRKGAFVVGLEWIAIVVLLVLHDSGLPMLTLGATEQTAFTVGVLVVAIHSGFRLGQLEKLRTVQRLSHEIEARESDS